MALAGKNSTGKNSSSSEPVRPRAFAGRTCTGIIVLGPSLCAMSTRQRAASSTRGGSPLTATIMFATHARTHPGLRNVPSTLACVRARVRIMRTLGVVSDPRPCGRITAIMRAKFAGAMRRNAGKLPTMPTTPLSLKQYSAQRVRPIT